MKYNTKTTTGIYNRIVKAMTSLGDIKVEVSSEFQPHYDESCNTIRLPTSISWAENDEEDFRMGRGATVHEASHVLFAPSIQKECEKMERKGVCPKDFAMWHNVFCDLNNEYKATELFPNLKDTLAETRKGAMRGAEKSDNPFFQVLQRCDMVGGTDKIVKWPDNYNPMLKGFVELVVKDYKKKKIHRATGKDLNQFTRDVFVRWTSICKKNKAGSMKHSKEIEKLLKKLGDAIKNGKPTGDIQKKIDELGKGEVMFKVKVTERQIRQTPHSKNNVAEMTIEKLKEKLKVDKLKNVQEDELSGAFHTGLPLEENTTYWQEESESDDYDKMAAYKQGIKVNRTLRKKVQLQADFEKKHRSGTIDLNEIRTQISKAGMIYKPTIFQRENTFTRGGQWAIEVLVDCSGSMSGYRMKNAKQAVATLLYALKGLPNVKTCITGFDHDYQYIVKRFKDNKFNIKKVDGLYAAGGTPTGKAMNHSLQRLQKFPKIKKILVVVTDGQPADVELVDEQLTLAKRMGVEAIGIGIPGARGDFLAKFPQNILFEDAQDLSTELTNVILNALGQKETVKLVKRAWE